MPLTLFACLLTPVDGVLKPSYRNVCCSLLPIFGFCHPLGRVMCLWVPARRCTVVEQDLNLHLLPAVLGMPAQELAAVFLSRYNHS
jgi:hypothetical protein